MNQHELRLNMAATILAGHPSLSPKVCLGLADDLIAEAEPPHEVIGGCAEIIRQHKTVGTREGITARAEEAEAQVRSLTEQRDDLWKQRDEKAREEGRNEERERIVKFLAFPGTPSIAAYRWRDGEPQGLALSSVELRTALGGADA
jgi:hypothetical protein